MKLNNKKYKIIDILQLDSKLYAYNNTCNHPLLVAMRHFVYKTNSKDLVKDGKMSCGDIVTLLKRIKQYRSQFEGRSLKKGQMQEKLLLKLQSFVDKNLFK